MSGTGSELTLDPTWTPAAARGDGSMKLALWSGFLFVSALCASVLTAGCGAGNGDGTSASLHGTLSVSLTDAASDKVDSFRVSVTAVDVRKSNSTIVHALAGPV